MLFVHEGSGVCSTRSSGRSATAPATTSSSRSARPGGSTRTRASTSGCSISSRPRRSSRRSATATTTASCSSTRPTAQRDLHAPDRRCRRGRRRRVRGPRQGRAAGITAYHYRHHPFDVVGWDGYLWPFRFNIADFQPITGRVHQPPPVHQTFAARNFVVCSFVPRKFDYHPLAIPAPYNHSNINSDEVIYYVAGNFMSRRGVDIASFTLHPAGIPHGPHPGTVEASIGKEGDRGAGGHGRHVPSALADARRPWTSRTPATRTPGCRPRTRARAEASELARARPGGVPGLTSSSRRRVSSGSRCARRRTGRQARRERDRRQEGPEQRLHFGLKDHEDVDAISDEDERLCVVAGVEPARVAVDGDG